MSLTSNIEEDFEGDFDIHLFNNYLVLAKKQYPDIDITLLQYSIASYMFYDVKGIKRPDDTNEEFIRVNNKIEELIKNTKIITKEIEDNQKKACEESATETTIESS